MERLIIILIVGEKIDSICWYLQYFTGINDVDNYTIAIKEKSERIPINSFPASNTLFYSGKQTGYSFIILSEENNYYRVQVDPTISKDRLYVIQDQGEYNFDNNYGYINKNDVRIINEQSCGLRNQWYQDESGRWYWYDENGELSIKWKEIDGNWYYFEESGAMKTGWIYVGAWYYLDEAGRMQTGLQTIGGSTYYFEGSGAMKTGWQWIEGKCYYFEGSGAMAKNQWIGDYWVDENGAWVQEKYKEDQWVFDGDGWRYRHVDGGYTINNFEKIDGKIYYFDLKGYLKFNWIEFANQIYYGDPNDGGAIATGWKMIKDKKYYFLSDVNNYGAMAKNGRYRIEGSDYIFDEDGILLKGWIEKEEGFYYSNDEGIVCVGWLKLNSHWYYLDPSNEGLRVQNETRIIDGNEYIFTEDGSIFTGIIEKEEGKYLINENGYLGKGWQFYLGDWYYCMPDGSETPGLLLENQWLTLGESTYYLGNEGRMRTGWFFLDESWYYAPDGGAIIKNGFGTIQSKHCGNQGDKVSYFEADGRLRTKSFTLGKVSYTVDESGYVVKTIVNGIPYFNQRDPRWANIWIGNWNICSTGCLPSVATSLINYLSGTNYSLIDLGIFLHQYGFYNSHCYGSSSDAWRFIANYYSYSFANNLSYEDIKFELLKGNIVVGAVGPGTFVKPGYTHELLLYGMDQEGYCYVYDPLDSTKNGRYHLSTIFNQRSTHPDDIIDFCTIED